MFDINLLDHEIFNPENNESEEDYYNLPSRMAEAGISLPFVTFEKVPVVHVLSYDGTHFRLSGLDSVFDTFKQAYRRTRDLKHEVKFDPSIFDSGQVIDRVLGVSVKGDETPGTTGPIYFQYNDPRPSEYHTYLSWLVQAKVYLHDPTDFLAAWKFLDGHPMSWHQSRPEKYPHDWTLSGAVAKIWAHPTTDDNGNLVFMMESGRIVPGTNYRYHDMRLDVYAPSYEAGIIRMAALTHKFFDLDGSERPDVDYEKSDLEKLLEERLASYNKAVQEGKQ